MYTLKLTEEELATLYYDNATPEGPWPPAVLPSHEARMAVRDKIESQYLKVHAIYNANPPAIYPGAPGCEKT